MKIKNFFLVTNPKIQNKWWHRFHQILVALSVVTFFIFGLFCLVIFGTSEAGDLSWSEKKYTSYSFEQEYALDTNKEEVCSFVESTYRSPWINCGDLSSSVGFLTIYTNARGTNDDLLSGMEELDMDYDEVLNLVIEDGQIDNISVKYYIDILVLRLISYILILLTAVLALFLMLESIFYRALIYIVYGKSKSVK